MFRLALAMLGNGGDADDAVQDAFVAVASRWEPLENPGAVGASKERDTFGATDSDAVVFIATFVEADTSPGATFDGSSCVYDGPMEFALDTEVTFTVLNASETNDVGFSVWKVPAGTTTTDITENGMFGIGADETTDVRAVRFQGTNTPGVEHDLVVDLDTPGTWVLNCWNGPGDGLDFPATAFTVTDN